MQPEPPGHATTKCQGRQLQQSVTTAYVYLTLCSTASHANMNINIDINMNINNDINMNIKININYQHQHHYQQQQHRKEWERKNIYNPIWQEKKKFVLSSVGFGIQQFKSSSEIDKLQMREEWQKTTTN